MNYGNNSDLFNLNRSNASDLMNASPIFTCDIPLYAIRGPRVGLYISVHRLHITIAVPREDLTAYTLMKSRGISAYNRACLRSHAYKQFLHLRVLRRSLRSVGLQTAHVMIFFQMRYRYNMKVD